MADAVTTTLGSGGARFALYASLRGQGPRELPIRGGGSIDPERRLSVLRVEAENVARDLPGWDQDPGLLDFEVRKIGPTVFYRADSRRLAQQIGPGRWLRLDAEDTQTNAGSNFATQLGGTNVSRLVDQLRAAGGQVRELGSEKVRGVATTGYSLKVDLDRYADELAPAEDRAGARHDADGLRRQTGAATLDTEVWVARDRRIRRLRMRAFAPSGGTTDVLMEFFDFGAPVRVRPPRGADTVDFGELAASAGQ